MDVATEIISIVLKAVVDNKVSGELTKELIGVSIDEASEWGINRIKGFINGEKTKIDHILSRDNMKSMNIPEGNIDYVVAEIMDVLSKVEITDEVLRQCKYDSMNLGAFLWNEYCVCKNGYIECESEIKRCLFTVAEALVELIRESKNFEKDILIQISNSVDEIHSEEQTKSQNIMERFDKLDESNRVIYDRIFKNIDRHNEDKTQKKVKSRTQEYADKWEANMFLNDFSEWDENAGVNIKLKDVYIDKHLPHFKWGDNLNESDELNRLLSEYIDEKKGNKMLLVLGQPGIGKSTLITWITIKYKKNFEDILVYQFASDLKNVDWQSYNVAQIILDKLGISFKNLNNKVLILDGFDEINAGDNRRGILDCLYEYFMNKEINNFSLIIMCRENYIREVKRLRCVYITLQPWDKQQIQSFCKLFVKKTNNNISEYTIKNIINNKEILGIPLILYMVLSLKINIDKAGSVVDIYDKIFSLEGGIYDRCIDNRYFADRHRIGNIKKYIHQISREIAIWMFENNPDEAFITQKEYIKICADISQDKTKHIEQDFLIGNFFKLKHCDGFFGKELYFVHRSIYEYFVAETICNAIEPSIVKLTEESQIELARNIVVYLKRGKITPMIGEYIQHKIIMLYYSLDIKKKQNFYQWFENAFVKMMCVGMFYYAQEEIGVCENILLKETQCFLNLMKILRLLVSRGDKKYILENANKKQLERYIKYCCIERNIITESKAKFLDFSNFYLMEANLERIDLSYTNLSYIKANNANLSYSKLEGVDLRESELIGANLGFTNLRSAVLNGSNLNGVLLLFADLCDAKLIGVDLCNANLRLAKLIDANLSGAKLYNADLSGADLSGANLSNIIFDDTTLFKAIISKNQVDFLKSKCNLQDMSIFMDETEEVISYEEYCMRTSCNI